MSFPDPVDCHRHDTIYDACGACADEDRKAQLAHAQVLADSVLILSKENKKLRKLWAAVQAYQVALKEGGATVVEWNDVREIINDLNLGFME